MNIENSYFKEELVLLDILKESYVISDNIKRLSGIEEEIIINEKASLLIESGIKNGKLIHFIEEQVISKNDFLVCKMSSSLSTVRTWYKKDPWENSYEQKEYKFIFDKIAFNLKLQKRSNFKQVKRYCIYKEDFLRQYEDESFYKNNYKWCNSHYTRVDKNDIMNIVKEIDEEFYKKSLFDYCKNIAYINTPQKICRYFNNDIGAYSSFKIGRLSEECFYSNSAKGIPSRFNIEKDELPHLPEEVLIQNLLDYFVISHERTFTLNIFFEKTYSSWFKQVYSFKNKYGEVVQKAIKIIDIGKQGKCLIPCTAWNKSYQSEQEYYCVPLSQKQILFNSDLLENKESRMVILTDSIEIADLNQNNSPDSIIWTSWLPDNCDDYDKIDWSPLKDVETSVYYLITNHSDISIEKAYVKTNEFCVYLEEKENIQIDNFIHIEIDYNTNDKSYFSGIIDIINQRLECQPKIVKNKIHVINKNKFGKNLELAKRELRKKNISFTEMIYSENELEKKSIKPEEKFNRKSGITDFLLRPIIVYGHTHRIFASPDVGKTSFVISLCASIISGKKLFNHKWWTIPKNDNKKYRKILYLDYEDTAGITERNIDKYAYSHFPNAKKEQEICKNNFIYLKNTNLNEGLLTSDNQEKLLALIDSCKNQGSLGQTVDLIVFDSYTKICAGVEQLDSWKKLKPLFSKIRKQNIATLIIHHTTKDGKLPSGFAVIKHDLLTSIKLDKSTNTDLTKPFLLTFEKFKTGFGNEKNNFYVYYSHEKKEWCTQNFDRVERINSLMNILGKASAGHISTDTAKLQIQNLELIKIQEIISILYEVANNQIYDIDIKEKIDKLQIPNDTVESENEEFVEIVRAHRVNGYSIDDIAKMLGMGKSTYHARIAHLIIEDYNNGLSKKKIKLKYGMSDKIISNILKKISKKT